jgi:hypothetical protein
VTDHLKSWPTLHVDNVQHFAKNPAGLMVMNKAYQDVYILPSCCFRRYSNCNRLSVDLNLRIIHDLHPEWPSSKLMNSANTSNIGAIMKIPCTTSVTINASSRRHNRGPR